MHTREAKALTLLSLAVALIFLAFLLSATDAHFVPPVVDLYLVCQYAKAMAAGHPFHYYPGDPASTGATSLLHTAILAGAYAAGARGEGLLAFAVLLGVALLVASAALARRIGERLGGRREGFLAGALVALGGPVVWGFLYGSDIALFMFLSLWLFERLLACWNGPWPSWGALAAATALALARPEGLPVGLALGLAWSLGPARRAPRKSRLVAWIPAAGGLGVLALDRAVTGLWLGTSLADKSLFANYGAADALALVAENAVDVVRGLLLGFYPSQAPVGFARGWSSLYFPPLGLLLALLVLARPLEALRAPLRIWAAILAGVYALTAPNMFAGVHFNRYVLWTVPSLLALVAAGLGVLSRLLGRGDEAADRAFFATGAGLYLLLGLLSTLRMGALYGEMAGHVYRRDWAAAQWIRSAIREGRLPEGVAMANLATSVEYLTGHHSLNLHGVTTPAFFGNRTAEREAGVFEALGRLPVAERPPYLVTTESAQEAYPTMRELVDGAPLYRTNSLSDEILIFRMKYDLVGKNGRFFLPETREAVLGLGEVDRLNVCDSRDEDAHGYSFRSRLGDLDLNGAARTDAYPGPPREVVIDGGRVVLGRESFRVSTRRGRDLVVVMRTTGVADAGVLRVGERGSVKIEIPDAGIVVRIAGQVAARVTLRPAAGWNEWVFRVPGRFLGEGSTRLELTGRYASFYYWFFQEG